MSLTVFTHAILQRDLSVIRDKHTSNDIFRATVQRISEVMAVELCKTFPLTEFTFETPLEITTGYRLRESYVLAPVLRAGLGLLDGFLKILPDASVSHIGVSRDHHTHLPNYYYSNIPAKISESHCIVLDPMLATGGSASMALDLLKQKGAKQLTLVSIVAAPEGVRAVEAAHPDVPIFTAALDRELNTSKYILPGLGDAGDRIFGT
ncbi:MAG: uracil phosphoribosyltransferase [Rhizobacter sp.]|nr:uracil phosphoribosyltransferase [Chlorobiales bacterium]